MKSIIFSTPMVQAILEGRKTQTRRVVKPQPSSIRQSPFSKSGIEDDHGRELKPKYQVGDILWIKETWRIYAWYQDDGLLDIEYLADGRTLNIAIPPECDPNSDKFNEYWEQSCEDYDKAGIDYNQDEDRYVYPGYNPCRKRPSIFMPKWASRIWLKVTDIRIQQLQDISEADAIAEGFNIKNAYIAPLGKAKSFAQHWFECLWKSINGKDQSKSWAANPWVWVYEFERAELDTKTTHLQETQLIQYN